jgi:LSD1 subclass zinc finger protein
MKCISLWQPWASLIVIGAKHYETRHWSTSYRGKILIHAAKRWGRDIDQLVVREPFRSALVNGGCRTPWSLPLGMIVGVADIVECYLCDTRALIGPKGISRPLPSEPELSLGDYTQDRYAWKLENPRRFPTPIPYRGLQQIFNVPDEVVAEQLAQAVAA